MHGMAAYESETNFPFKKPGKRLHTVQKRGTKMSTPVVLILSPAKGHVMRILRLGQHRVLLLARNAGPFWSRVFGRCEAFSLASG